ncbi:hypothetical protein NUW58_g4114 [Xylaria curta]|uniref:Uncharacterized protein n=1 Tax=Xylaria curta TaxID=42375 RepID=A0ACC1P7U3_9PEZI|nr:hypothetical protein NUW58_g4114 [Xylaria curta]
MRRPSLLARLLVDVTMATSSETGKIDIQKLASQPLTQSMHAEILRLYIAIFTLRHGEIGPVHFGGYELSTEQLALIYSRTGALDKKSWLVATTGLGGERKAAQGAAIESRDRQFAMDALAGILAPLWWG